jgi:hypothetical protein
VRGELGTKHASSLSTINVDLNPGFSFAPRKLRRKALYLPLEIQPGVSHPRGVIHTVEKIHVLPRPQMIG